MSEMLLDRAGRRRSPATMPGFHAGRPPRNEGLRYPADPPKVEEIVAVMRRRQRARPTPAWLDRGPLAAGLRIQEAVGLEEGPRCCSCGYGSGYRVERFGLLL